MLSSILVFTSITYLTHLANAESSPLAPSLFDRNPRAAGGWSLSQGICPDDLDSCGSAWCCPKSTTCQHTGYNNIANLCCPGTIDCYSAMVAGPFCADDTWSLWNATESTMIESSTFCCLPGQVGMQDGVCVTPDLISSPDQIAEQLSPGKGGSVTGSRTSSMADETTSASSLSSAVETSTSKKVISTSTIDHSTSPSTPTGPTVKTISTTRSVDTGTASISPVIHSSTVRPTFTPTGKGGNSTSATATPTFIQASGGDVVRKIGFVGLLNSILVGLVLL